jgi:hypothetical protein
MSDVSPTGPDDRLDRQEVRADRKVLNVESGSYRDLASDLDVSTGQMVMGFHNGKEVGRLVGVRDESANRKLLEEVGVKG